MSNTFTTPAVVTTLSQSRLDYNESLLTLLQNFASAGQPSGGDITTDGTTGLRTGMLWYKSGSDTADGQGRMLVYDGTGFTRNGLVTYKMPSVVAANSAVVASKISYGELVSVGTDALYMVNSANTGIFQVGRDALTLSGLTSTQFVRTDVTSTITANLTFSGSGFVKVPSGNDAQRPTSPVAGMFRFNSDTISFEGYDGVEWGAIGGGGAFTDDGTYIHYTGSANVGIGIATPSANLHVVGTGNLLKLETGTATDANGVTLRLQQTDTTMDVNQSYGGVEWAGLDVGNVGVRGYIKGIAEGTSGEFGLRLATQGSGVSAPVDRVNIGASGNVGIGVSANTTLQIAGNVSMSGGDATIFNRENFYLALGANNIEAIRILPSTNIGIGLTAPTANLHVAGTGSIVKLQTATATDANGVAMQFVQSDTTIISGQGYGGVEWLGSDIEGSGVRGYIRGFGEGTSGEFGLRLATQGSGVSAPIDRLYVVSNGNVGIGAISPSERLEVYGTAKANNITSTVLLTSTTANLDGAVTVNESGAAVDFRVESDTQTHAIFLQGVSSNVGLNTSNPSRKLHLFTSDTSNTQVMLEQGSTGDVGIQFKLTGEKDWTLGVDNSDGNSFKIENGFSVGSSNDFVIASNGFVAIGTANPTARLSVNGVTKSLSYTETVVTLSGTTPSVNCTLGNIFELTTSGATTFTFTNPPASGTAYSFTLTVTAGGAHTLTWPASVRWSLGFPPSAPASGNVDVYIFFTTNAGTTWYGFQAGDALS
jgi:hypothetical protein